MDEPVGPGADEHAFDQFVGPAPRPDLGEVSIEPDARRAAAPAPLLGRDGGDVLHAALDAQTGARVSLVAAGPGLDEVGERRIVGGQIDHPRSAERRVGKEGVSTCKYRWSR